MKFFPFAGMISVFLFFVATSVFADVTVDVKNNLDIPRASETIELKWSDIESQLPGVPAENLLVLDQDGKEVATQPVWLEGHKKPASEILFQSDFGPGQEKKFTLKDGVPSPYQPRVYGRWVPERHDDFAWENDRIAFRIYGPELSAMDPASSGIDVWPKRTRALIVNKWYQIAQSINDGYYHYDHGEGLDNYKVGHGQGCGGTALLLNGKRMTTGTQGWKTQRVIANGPIRLIFELTYDPIAINGSAVTETKRIMLDAGQNLNHFQSTFSVDSPVGDLQVMSGIGEHHDRPFENEFHKDAGWMSYWDPGDGPGEKKPAPGTSPTGYVGTGVVMLPAQVQDTFEMNGQMEMVTRTTAGQPVNYWAGAGWDQSGDFKDYDAWKIYLANFARGVSSPLVVSISR